MPLEVTLKFDTQEQFAEFIGSFSGQSTCSGHDAGQSIKRSDVFGVPAGTCEDLAMDVVEELYHTNSWGPEVILDRRERIEKVLRKKLHEVTD